jgi:hypothetical protein
LENVFKKAAAAAVAVDDGDDLLLVGEICLSRDLMLTDMH